MLWNIKVKTKNLKGGYVCWVFPLRSWEASSVAVIMNCVQQVDSVLNLRRGLSTQWLRQVTSLRLWTCDPPKMFLAGSLLRNEHSGLLHHDQTEC